MIGKMKDVVRAGKNVSNCLKIKILQHICTVLEAGSLPLLETLYVLRFAKSINC